MHKTGMFANQVLAVCADPYHTLSIRQDHWHMALQAASWPLPYIKVLAKLWKQISLGRERCLGLNVSDEQGGVTETKPSIPVPVPFSSAASWALFGRWYSCFSNFSKHTNTYVYELGVYLLSSTKAVRFFEGLSLNTTWCSVCAPFWSCETLKVGQRWLSARKKKSLSKELLVWICTDVLCEPLNL